MRKLTATQKKALQMIAEDGDADGVYAFASGPTPGMARHNVDGTMEALWGWWSTTDTGS